MLNHEISGKLALIIEAVNFSNKMSLSEMAFSSFYEIVSICRHYYLLDLYRKID